MVSPVVLILVSLLEFVYFWLLRNFTPSAGAVDGNRALQMTSSGMNQIYGMRRFAAFTISRP
jgi:hypothetical protein